MARSAITQAALNQIAIKGGFEGFRDVQTRIGYMLDATTGAEIKNIYLSAALLIKQEAVARAHRGPTGHLKAGVFAGRGDENKPNALVGLNYRVAPHAHLVEYGTVKMSPRPYFRPAIAARKRQVGEHIITGFFKILDKYGK